MNFNNGKELLNLCIENKFPISEIMIKRELSNIKTTREEIINRMEKSLTIMENNVKIFLGKNLKTMGGLIGGEAQKLNKRRLENKSFFGNLLSKAIAYAMGFLEVNASMEVIVATPTAGASGILPAVLLSLKEEYNLSKETILNGLFNASAIGYLLMKNASVSGAEAGCQAEVGSACSMAASAIVEIFGGTPEQCLTAASIALQNLLGLVCDPVYGLVEVPCQSRNAIGTSNAFICAEMALSGIKSIISFDEMAKAMYSVGLSIPFELRETALGGCAKCKIEK